MKKNKRKFTNIGSNAKVFPVCIEAEKNIAFLEAAITAFRSSFDETDRETQNKVNDIVQIFQDALKEKHNYTAGHVERVSGFTEKLASLLDFSEKERNEIAIAAKLHDVGKLVVPNKILASDKALDSKQNEPEIMKYHAAAGAGLLEVAVQDEEVQNVINGKIIQGIKYHHKRWDGLIFDENGEVKPEKDPIREEKIGDYALLIAVGDCIDAMVSQRAYNSPKNVVDCFKDLWKNRGQQFKKEYAEAAIIMLGKEISSLGLDPIDMFSEVPVEGSYFYEKDCELVKFLNDNKDEFEVN